MKKIIVLASIVFLTLNTIAQNVGINTTGNPPDNSAMLDIDASNKGLLIPRVALSATNNASPVTSPATSLLVYNTATAGTAPNNVTPGYYYWNGTNWVRLLNNSGDNGTAWLTTGNTGTSPSNNFIGTIDNTALVFRTNNTEQMRLHAGGQLSIGHNIAGGKLDVHQTSSNDVARFITYGNPNDIRLRRTQGTLASPTATSGANTILGRIFAEGYNGSGFTAAAAIEMTTDAAGGTPSDMPGRITFSTTPDGSGVLSERMRITNDGNVGIGTTTPSTRLHVVGKTTLTRDNVTECCGNDATLALGELTLGPVGTGRRASISFHNAYEAEGQMRLIHNTLHGVSSRRFQFFDNQNQGIGLELTGRLWYGNAGSRTETRNNASLQGNAGAQSGFFETDNPQNFPAGATGWWHLIDVRHSNTGNNYALQIAGSFYDQELWFRKTNNNPAQPWTRILSQNNLNSFAWQLTGNSGTNPSTNFIGTTDNNDFAVRTNNTERIRITNVGNVGIGTTNPLAPLDVRKNINHASGNGTNQDGPTTAIITAGNNGRLNDWPVGWGGGLSTWDIVGASTYFSAYITRSDERFKNNINNLSSSLNQIMKLRPVSYFMDVKYESDNKEHLHFGFIAQEVENIFPNLVVTTNNGYKGMNYMELIPVLTKAIQEQQAIIEKQNKEIELLQTAKKELDLLKEEIILIKKQINASNQLGKN